MTWEQNSAFSKQAPRVQLAWDSTSLGLLKECPYKYYLSMIEGWETKAANVHLSFGILYHKCLEIYDKRRAEGLDHEAALRLATRHALEGSVLRNDDGSFSPWPFDLPQKSRFVLVRTVVWYLEEFKDDLAKTFILSNGKPAVELSFKFEPGWKSKSEGESILLCGHLDRVVSFQDALWIMDRKTTKSTISSSYFAKYSPDNQMSLYSSAGQVVLNQPLAGLIIDAVQLAVGFSRFQRGFIPRTSTQNEEWMEDTLHWIHSAERWALLQQWPMNDKSCHNYGGCKFTEICSKDSSVRQIFLESNFTRRVWDPLISRED